MLDPGAIHHLFDVLHPVLDERSRRLVAAGIARTLGRGGVAVVARATGMARSTLERGLDELAPPVTTVERAQRIRRPGGGRKPLTEHDPTLVQDLEALVDPVTRGDPQSPLRWTCKSLRQLARALQTHGHRVSPQTVSELLRALGYSLQANRKTQEGAAHPDRNAQFEYLNAQAAAFQQRGQPVISVDTKKKELIGAFKNGGQEWQPMGQPEAVQVHDFPSQAQGRAIPYGVYDVGANQGWVSVGTDHDTAEFAVATVRRWWDQMGAAAYPEASEVLIMADGGGSNSSRSRLWKLALQELTDATGLHVTVCHFPPGTSKWNKIEHRLFSYISQNWRGRPLLSHEVIVNLIGSTTTQTGLRVAAALDTNHYPTKKHVSDEALATIQLQRHAFHGEWNYSISPASQPRHK
jgi:DNA-binding phage protein